MVQFFFKFDGEVLKARLPRPGEELTHPLEWKGLIQFQMTSDSLFMVSWTSLIPDLPPEAANALVKIASARYPVSPEYDSLQKLCPELVVAYEAEEWVFFGGTFHPWHAGHQACLNLLPEEKTCFVLPDHNPLKNLRELHPVGTIIELSSRIRFKKNQFLVPTFLLEKKKNPTVTWIERLRQDYPQKKLSLLLGFDSLKNLPQWVRYEDLLRYLDHIYVASRLEEDKARDEVSGLLNKIAPKVHIEFLGRHEFEALSSTELRRK